MLPLLIQILNQLILLLLLQNLQNQLCNLDQDLHLAPRNTIPHKMNSTPTKELTLRSRSTHQPQQKNVLKDPVQQVYSRTNSSPKNALPASKFWLKPTAKSMTSTSRISSVQTSKCKILSPSFLSH